MKRSVRFASLALVPALVACGRGGSPDVGSGGPPADAPTALVYGAVSSPVYDELKKVMRLVPYDGSQKVADHDMVVFDGDAHTPAGLAGEEGVASALRAGKWVLGVDLNEAHKRDGLGSLLDFASKGFSPGYLVRTDLDRNGRAQVTVLEYPKASVALRGGPREIGAQAAQLLAASATAISPTPQATAAFVKSVVGKLKRGPARARPQQVGDTQFPAGLLYKTFFFSEPVLLTTPTAHKPPDPKTQTGVYSLNYTMYVFLDNRNEPQGNFQYVLAELEGEANPTNGTGQFANMVSDEKAYFQSRYLMRLWPTDDALFVPVGSSPPTANNVTQVTSTIGFSVGYTQQGETPAPGATFSYSRTETRNITDWKLTNESAGNRVGWYYRSENPWSVDDWYNGVDPYNGFYGSSYPAQPNDLALSQLQVHAQAVWKTQSVLDRWVDFDYHREYELTDLYCGRNFGWVCWGGRKGDWAESSFDNKFSINLGVVVPVPLQPLTFSPNPVKAGQPATGTVTLARPAETDTVIALSSNSTNASVLPTVTIPKDQTSATFQILTSSNGGAPGSSFRVTITAFYAQNYQAQLTIQN